MKGTGGSDLTALGKALRRARGSMSQEAVAEALAVDQSTVSRWERGRIALTVSQLLELERLFGLEPGESLQRAGLTTDRVREPNVLSEHFTWTLDDALDLVRAAATLSLSVTLYNQNVPDADDPDIETEQWVVHVGSEPPSEPTENRDDC